MFPRKLNVFFWETPNDPGSSEPAPGTGEDGVEGIDPTAAEPTTPDSGSTPPQQIPYSRFKEVNDARRALEEQLAPIRELQEAGYGAADLQRLVAWETEFASDPGATLATLVDQAEGLTDEAKQAIKDQLTVAPAAKETETDPGSSSPKPEGDADMIPLEKLPPEVRESVERDRARQAAEKSTAVSAALDRVLEAWDEMDVKDGIATPQGSKLAWLAAASANESDPIAILENARAGYVADRQETDKSAIEVLRNGDTGPSPVPSGGSGASRATPPAKPKSLAEATRMAEAAAARGTLVMNDE